MSRRVKVEGYEVVTVPEPFWWRYPLDEIVTGPRRIIFEEVPE